MPLGLPNHLAPHNLARAYASASHGIAVFGLVGALIVILGIQSLHENIVMWPCLVALVPFALSLALLDRRRTSFYAAAYLLIGGASLYWYAVTGTFEFSVAGQTDAFVLSLPKYALIFVGAGYGVVSMLAWAAAGLLVAEVAVALAAIQAGGHYSLDVGALSCLLGVAALLIVLSVSRNRSTSTQPSFARAARDEHLSAVRYRIEVKAAAIMHDTVLSHLAALASSAPGPLQPELRAQITRDLEVLLGEEWLLDADVPDAQHGPGWRDSDLASVIEESRALGLDIDVSGDVSAVTRLAPDRERAVALAAKQCLVNVLRHSGVTNAEVVVYGSEKEISVMVIDAGRGFTETETGADRLGLRQSVRQRIAAVGGAVQVWSTPGRGTSVMIRVPATADATAESAATS